MATQDEWEQETGSTGDSDSASPPPAAFPQAEQENPSAPKAPVGVWPASSSGEEKGVSFSAMLGERSSPGRQQREIEYHVGPRRIALPVMLFLLTCAATFWVACTQFSPEQFPPLGRHPDGWMANRLAIIQHWPEGLAYMACVIAILFSHEMGHYIGTLIYRVPATLPFFIPFPMTPMGTMGAVISMDGQAANRRQIFDIGIAGPLAGLVIAIPVAWYGVTQIDVEKIATQRIENEAGLAFEMPLAMQWMSQAAHPELRGGVHVVATRQMNPYLMAGWFGMLITGLNMMPVSQLDGGHVMYGLFGKGSRFFGRTFIFLSIFFVATQYDRVYVWVPMLLLVILIGIDHPPTANDNARLGPMRTMLGFASLLIPVLCFPIFGVRPLGM